MGGGAMPTPVAVVSRTTAAANSLSHHPFSNKGPYLGETSTNNLECVGIREDKGASRTYYDNTFGPVPSQIEIKKAMSDLQKFMLGHSASKSETSGLHQMLYRRDPSILQSLGYRRINDAYHMLQTEPLVQDMVVSISSDKAVWDAILNNRAVQDFKGSLNTAKEERPEEGSNEESDLATLILKWIFGITKSKVVELMEKFSLLVNEIFQPADKENPTSDLTDLFEEKVRSSLLLAIVILLIVVVTRKQTG